MRLEIIERPNGSKRVMMHCDQPSLTRQEFKDECDLELTIKRFSGTVEGRQALQNAQGYVNSRFEDVSEVPDYRTAFDQINRANEVFMALPAKLRTRFDNDAARFLDFIDDPKNIDEMKSLGLVRVDDVKSPVKPVDSGVATPPVKG